MQVDGGSEQHACGLRSRLMPDGRADSFEQIDVERGTEGRSARHAE